MEVDPKTLELFRLLADLAELTLLPIAVFLWKMDRRIFRLELVMQLRSGIPKAARLPGVEDA